MARTKVLTFFEKIITPRYQITALLVTLIIIFMLSIPPFSRFVSLEPSPQIFSVTPKKVKEWGGNTTEVTVGLHITNFPEFDIVNNNFMVDGIIWFEFDPALVSLETVEKFSFEKGDIISKTTAETKLIEGKFFVQYNIRIKFTSNLSFEFFPLDDHRIYLALTNKFVSPSEIVFRSYISGFTISDSIFIAGWKIVGSNVTTGYSEAYLDKNDDRKVVFNPKIVFAIDFERSGVQQVFLIFLPLFLMFFIGIFSFTLSTTSDRTMILSLSLGSVTAILSYRYVIQNLSPKVGYFLLSDHIFTLFLAYAVIGFFLNMVLLQYKTFKTYLIVIRGLVFLSFHIMLVLLWYYLLYIWIEV